MEEGNKSTGDKSKDCAKIGRKGSFERAANILQRYIDGLSEWAKNWHEE